MSGVGLRRAGPGSIALLALTIMTALSGSPADARSTRPPKDIPGPLNHAAPAMAYCYVAP